MIHQNLSFQVILGSGNRIVKMPARQLPYVLSLGVRKPIFMTMTFVSVIHSSLKGLIFICSLRYIELTQLRTYTKATLGKIENFQCFSNFWKNSVFECLSFERCGHPTYNWRNIWKLHFFRKNMNEMIQICCKQNKFKFNFMSVRRNRKISQSPMKHLIKCLH